MTSVSFRLRTLPTTTTTTTNHTLHLKRDSVKRPHASPIVHLCRSIAPPRTTGVAVIGPSGVYLHRPCESSGVVFSPPCTVLTSRTPLSTQRSRHCRTRFGWLPRLLQDTFTLSVSMSTQEAVSRVPGRAELLTCSTDWRSRWAHWWRKVADSVEHEQAH